jgi:hypothetical protein
MGLSFGFARAPAAMPAQHRRNDVALVEEFAGGAHPLPSGCEAPWWDLPTVPHVHFDQRPYEGDVGGWTAGCARDTVTRDAVLDVLGFGASRKHRRIDDRVLDNNPERHFKPPVLQLVCNACNAPFSPVIFLHSYKGLETGENSSPLFLSPVSPLVSG